MRYILTIIILLFSGYAYASSPEIIRVTDLEGKSFKGDGIKFDNNQITLLSKGITPATFACVDIAGISFHNSPVTQSLRAESVFRITLVSHDIIYGVISDTAKNGFAVHNIILGRIALNFEQISSIERVEDKESSLSLRILDAVKKAEREDTVFLISGDVDSGIVISLTPESVSIKSTLYNQDRTYKMKDIRTINLFSFTANTEKTSKGNLEAIVYLSDGSRLIGSISPSLSERAMVLAQSKGNYQIPIDAIGFIYFKNDRCVYLSDLEPSEVKEYISPKDETASFLWHCQKDRGLFSQKPISIQGNKYYKGLSAHANCELTYKLDGAYQKFFATIGIGAEGAGAQADNLSGSVRFVVYVDGKKSYESEVFRKDTPPKDIFIDIKGAKELRLVVDDAGDGYVLDRAAWALARVIK
ncbi:MAG: NPCBM/NEW2 domain-containing protein [Planctomycetota bacterium]